MKSERVRAVDAESRHIVGLAQREGSGDPHYVNLTSAWAVVQYIQKANEIARYLPTTAGILDWGCGSGQMAYLLWRRGFQPTALDRGLPNFVIARKAGIEPLVSPGNARLPLADQSFDAVVGCGVLEHVADQSGRLKELWRILRPGGLLFVYNYPNRLSWIEWLTKRLHGPNLKQDEEGNFIGHERMLRLDELADLIRCAGFYVVEARTENILPLTFRRMPKVLQTATVAHWRLMELVENCCYWLPFARELGTNLNAIARKPLADEPVAPESSGYNAS